MTRLTSSIQALCGALSVGLLVAGVVVSTTASYTADQAHTASALAYPVTHEAKTELAEVVSTVERFHSATGTYGDSSQMNAAGIELPHNACVFRASRTSYAISLLHAGGEYIYFDGALDRRMYINLAQTGASSACLTEVNR